jgi:hypothetical protein
MVRVKDVKYLRAIEDVKGCPSATYAIYIYMVLPLSGGVLLIPTPNIELQGLSPLVHDMPNRLVLIRNISIFNMLPPTSD